MAPQREVALHLVGHEAYELIALLAGRHGLQAAEELKHHVAVVAHRYLPHGVAHGLGLGVYRLGLLHVVGIVYVELEVAHQREVVPQLALVVHAVGAVREHALHYRYYGVGALLPPVAVGYADGVVYHALHLTSVLGKYEALTLCVVVQSFYIHYIICMCKIAVVVWPC